MRTVYLVPNTHYDVAWAFTREDYFKIFEAILEAGSQALGGVAADD